MRQKILICDTNNLAFVTRFSKLSTPKSRRKKDPNATEYIFFNMLNYVAMIANKFSCDSIIVACDSKDVWRKKFYPEYKARPKDDDIYKEETLAAADKFITFMKENTSAMVLAVPNCEADDIIGHLCLNKPNDIETLILSTDKDYIQLLSESVSLYSITKRDFYESDDPEYDLFVKCIRGDRNDNILSAYPRVRETTLKECYDDDMKLLNLMETVLDDGRKVGDLFMTNSKLIDLSLQPEWIVESIKKTVQNCKTEKYSELSVMSVLGSMGIKNKSDVLEGRSAPFRNKPQIE